MSVIFVESEEILNYQIIITSCFIRKWYYEFNISLYFSLLLSLSFLMGGWLAFPSSPYPSPSSCNLL